MANHNLRHKTTEDKGWLSDAAYVLGVPAIVATLSAPIACVASHFLNSSAENTDYIQSISVGVKAGFGGGVGSFIAKELYELCVTRITTRAAPSLHRRSHVALKTMTLFGGILGCGIGYFEGSKMLNQSIVTPNNIHT